MDTSACANQPLRWNSAEIIEFPDPHPPYKLPNGKLWKTLIQLQKGGLVRVMRDPLGVLRFCAVKQEIHR